MMFMSQINKTYYSKHIKQSIAISIEWNIILTIKRKGSGGSGSPKTHFNRQNSKDSIDGKNGDGYSRQHSENHIDTKNDEIDSERIKQEDVVVEVKSTNGKSGEEASKSKQGASLVTKEEPTNGTFTNGTAKSDLGTDRGTIKKPPPNQVWFLNTSNHLREEKSWEHHDIHDKR